MVKIVDITSPPRSARSAPQPTQEGAPQRRSSSMPTATLGLQGRTGGLQTKPEDSGPPPTRRPPPPKPSRPTAVPHREPAVSGTEASASAARAAALAEARAEVRAGKAKAVAAASPGRSGPPPVENTDQWRDIAAAAILNMEWYVGDPGKSVTENQAAMQIRIKRLHGMADLKADALRFQAEMRKQMNGLDGSAKPESYKKWVQAASVNLEAVFQKAEVGAEAAAQDMQARLDAVSHAGSDLDSDSDTEFFDASAEFVSDSDSDVELENEVHAAAATHVTTATDTDTDTPPVPPELSPQAEMSSTQPPARSLEAERIGLNFRPGGHVSDQENGLALKNKISDLEKLQKSRDQFSSADNAKIEGALADLRDRMKELKEHLREKGIPESLFFRKPTPPHEIEAARERSRREAQEALDLGHYTF